MKNQAEEADHIKEAVNGFRLSPQQKRVWRLQQANRAWPRRVSCAVLVEGSLDTARLRAAVEKAASRHEILRTTLNALPGKIPLQLPSEVSICWQSDVDISGLDESQQKARLEALLRKHGHGALHQEVLQLCRVALSPNMQVLLISLPMLCADAQTLQNLVSEIGRCYAAETFSDEPLQYAVVSEWLNELLEADEAAAGREYWRAHDPSALPALTLPFEKTASEAEEFEIGVFSHRIHHESAAQIKSLCGRYGATPDAFLLACWQVLLFRMSGEPNFVVGTAFDGRADEELKELLGPLTKYLPIHSRFDQGMKFAKFLEQAQASMDEARKWQECFTWEHSNTFSANGNSLSFFPIAFDYQEWAKFHAHETSFSVREQFICPEPFKLKLCCVQTSDSLTAEFHYHAARFSLADIECVGGRFGELMESICHNPEARISELLLHLKQRLPDYMMSTAFVQIDALPITTNGRVDRASHPAPHQLNPKPFVAPFVAPRTAFEEQLATIWRELLKVEQVGVNDNFFELGGQSLIATQLALRVQETFNVSLTLQLIFDNPTINDLAAAITTKLSEAEDQAELNQMLEDLKELSAEEIKVLLDVEG